MSFATAPPPEIFFLRGVWAILCGTVLYWPLERFRDWQAELQEKWSIWRPGFTAFHRGMLWIRARPKWRVIYRLAFVAIGLGLIAFGAL